MNFFKVPATNLLIFWVIFFHSNIIGFAFTNYDPELYEDGPCKMEDGNGFGKCVPLPNCPYRIKQVITGKRFSTATGRCTFKGMIEIVCCPEEITDPKNKKKITSNNSSLFEKLGLRPADIACLEYEQEMTGIEEQKINPNIFNGKKAEFGEFPYMVALGYKNYEDGKTIKYNCGGSLISSQHVLTAAHCVNNINNFIPSEVRLGAVNLQDDSDYVQSLSIAEIITHPNYRRSLNYYDLAILKLSRKISISNTVMPICLQNKPIPNLSQLVNMSLIVTGWGTTDFESSGTNNLQKTPQLKIVDNLECNKSYEGFSKLPRGIDESMICMIDNNSTRRSDACQGDSGGPLLLLSTLSKTVLGITSFGQSCSGPVPAVYTSVFYYLDWIEEVVWQKKL